MSRGAQIMNNKNILLKVGMAELGIRQYQAAKILGLSEGYFSKILRDELTECKQIEMLERIREGTKKYAEQ